MFSKRKNSYVWNFFDVHPDNPTKAICTLCLERTEISRGKTPSDFSTSPLDKHLKAKHAEVHLNWKTSKGLVANPNKQLYHGIYSLLAQDLVALNRGSLVGPTPAQRALMESVGGDYGCSKHGGSQDKVQFEATVGSSVYPS